MNDPTTTTTGDEFLTDAPTIFVAFFVCPLCVEMPLDWQRADRGYRATCELCHRVLVWEDGADEIQAVPEERA